mmetsp:Transcript_61226/g.89833  ORF Transcript_61226/g.89833 Transcript_61226/m.89833 type:complete len:246 (+) Transcript_61226:486-1223(+)
MCGFSGEDPNQCLLAETKLVCIFCDQAMYCEGCCSKEDGACCKQEGLCFCKKEEKSFGGKSETKCCCVKHNCRNQLEPPCDNNKAFFKVAARCCCFFQRDLARCVSFGGDAGLCSDNQRCMCCVNSCILPPKKCFVEVLTIRCVGPPKSVEVFETHEAGGPVQVVSANFGRADADLDELPLPLMMNRAYEYISDAVWDMVPDSESSVPDSVPYSVPHSHTSRHAARCKNSESRPICEQLPNSLTM